MKKKANNNYSIIRKIVYFILFSLIIGAFIFLSNKYENLSKSKKIDFNYYYKNIETDHFQIINANNLISYTKEGRHLIFIGNSSSKWSIKYAELLTEILKEMNLDAGYYDIKNDKTQKNSNYYAVLEVLKNHLITTDSSNNNLLAPSFYIFTDGEIKYYNIDTVATKNSMTVKEYWKISREEEFIKEIKTNIKRYYLNN